MAKRGAPKIYQTLTREEKRLLLYPPTRNTWYCPKCRATCYGSDEECWVCDGKRKDATELAYPVYERALEKVQKELDAAGTSSNA